MSQCLICGSFCREKYCTQRCRNRMRTLRRQRQEREATDIVARSGKPAHAGKLAIDGQQERIDLYQRRAELGLNLFEGVRR